MAARGIAPHVVEKLLNHSSGTISGVAAVYNRHAYLGEQREAVEAWGLRLMDVIEGPVPSKVAADSLSTAGVA